MPNHQMQTDEGALICRPLYRTVLSVGEMYRTHTRLGLLSTESSHDFYRAMRRELDRLKKG